MKLGAIEAGGTKFVVCIGNEKEELVLSIWLQKLSPQHYLHSYVLA